MAASRSPSRRQLEKELAALSDATRASKLEWFFKAGNGQYGAGDRFLGIRVPELRKISSRYRTL
jgi:hypothetical protein